MSFMCPTVSPLEASQCFSQSAAQSALQCKLHNYKGKFLHFNFLEKNILLFTCCSQLNVQKGRIYIAFYHLIVLPHM